MPSPLEQLALADPDLSQRLASALEKADHPVPETVLGPVVEQILEALSQELSFGYTLADAYEKLFFAGFSESLSRFFRLMAEAARVGPTLGRVMAEHGAAVFASNSPLLMEAFVRTTDTLRSKGTYTLNRPLETLGRILDGGDEAGALAFLDLLADTFSREMSYNQCLHLTRLIPRAVTRMAPFARKWQIPQLHRVLSRDLALAEPFLDAMEKGLELLTQQGLTRFVDAGLVRAERVKDRGRDFFSLTSMEAVTLFQSLQVTVSLAGTAGRINRYLRARTGKGVRVRPFSALPQAMVPRAADGPSVCTDGRFIYLPETLGVFEDRDRNLSLYRDLACLESALAEFHTYVFDLERLSLRCTLPEGESAPGPHLPEMVAFFHRFDDPALAEALLTIAEHGRLQRLMTGRYPGLARRLCTLLRQEARQIDSRGRTAPLDDCYARIVMGERRSGKGLDEIIGSLEAGVDQAATIEDCAALVVSLYPAFQKKTGGSGQGDLVHFPFGRRLRPDLFFMAHKEADLRARDLQNRLRAKGIRIYRADLFQKLMTAPGEIRPEDIRPLARKGPDGDRSSDRVRLSREELAALLGRNSLHLNRAGDGTGSAVFWYPEWDSSQGDYLDRHCRVLEKSQAPGPTDELFPRTLTRYRGLVRRIRHAFELLRPQGLTILRPWLEGDDFDYRAMLDFSLDRRAGLMPSDRLYIKRLKQQRDVAVLLLVDLSRSTANSVNGIGISSGNRGKSVLDLEKEAMVLFCEALGVVGDRFAIAGFSGTGRLGVDYYQVKDFDEPMGPVVRRRLSGLKAQRSTRMGAAIRHATASFQKVSAAVRLMILLGDGFPNDADYKGDHAIADTRRAVNEARSKNIFTHGITVNVAADPRLDDLYGRVRHNIISDVRELPDKLLRIYSALTR